MKGIYVLTIFRGCILSWLTTLNLDRGNDRSFNIYYHNFPMGTCLKHFINTYRCVCWMKSTSIDGLDVPYILTCIFLRTAIPTIYNNSISPPQSFSQFRFASKDQWARESCEEWHCFNLSSLLQSIERITGCIAGSSLWRNCLQLE